MTDLYEPAHRLAALLRERKVSAVELLGEFEARLGKVNPAINAVVATNFEAARERARQADAALARGESWGPLHGLPMTIKDSWEVAGMPTACGAPALKGHMPKANAPAVQRLVDAGAIVFGKTNTPFYASDLQTFNKVYGTTNNPWNRERTPGGSSGGAAAALAAGLTPLEFGSDIGGSIRTPAHFCGVWGHNPTYGLVPTRGHIPGPPGTIGDMDMEVGGPLARSAEDLVMALRVLAGPLAPAAKGWRLELPPPRRTALEDFRVHVWLEDPACPTDAAMRAVLDAAVERVRQAGCTVTTGAPLGLSLAELYESYFLLLCSTLFLPDKLYRRALIAGTFAHWLGRDAVNTVPGVLRRVAVSHRDWRRTNEKRAKLRLKLEEFFKGVDVLLMPVAPSAAPAHAQEGNPYERTIPVNGRPQGYGTQFMWISLATLAGLPATSVPVGLTADRLPVGLQVVGAHLEDLTTIEFARLIAAPPGPPPLA